MKALDDLALVGGDDTGGALRVLIQSRRKVDGRRRTGYSGPRYSELNAEHQQLADEKDASVVDGWRRLLAEAADWPEGQRDSRGRGWESLAFQCAWSLAKMAACGWSSMTDEQAKELYIELLPPDMAADEVVGGKWYDDIVDKAAGELVDEPPWELRGDARQDFQRVAGNGNTPVDVSNPATTLRWLLGEVGVGSLAGMFRRGIDLVHTPRVGEQGYVEPDSIVDSNGPAQVRRLGNVELAARLDTGYSLFGADARGKVTHRLFPQEVASRALSAVDLMSGVSDLRMVTHTPMVRADGTVLDKPGYDEASGALYLPDRRLVVEPVPDQPSGEDVDGARKLLLDLLVDFPFVTPHDRANYLGALFTPLLRQLVGPPYKLLVISAPQRGSGKSLLALVMRELHGGVFRAEFPREDAEVSKAITALLDCTSAPVVQFDNVTGVLKSAVLDGLLTSVEWTDRLLGGSRSVTLPNDRLWVVTGNNIHIGGDLERRTLWCTINADMEHPEQRAPSVFAIPNLEAYVREQRGALLRAMLVLVRGWAVAGMARGEAPTSDSFGEWLGVVRGVLEWAGVGGTFGHVDTAPEASDPERDEWERFLAAVLRVMASGTWTAQELLDKVNDWGGEAGAEGIGVDELPSELADKLRHGRGSAARSLGKWLSFRDSQWTGGMCVRRTGSASRALRWYVDTKLV